MQSLSKRKRNYPSLPSIQTQRLLSCDNVTDSDSPRTRVAADMERLQVDVDVDVDVDQVAKKRNANIDIETDTTTGLVGVRDTPAVYDLPSRSPTPMTLPPQRAMLHPPIRVTAPPPPPTPIASPLIEQDQRPAVCAAMKIAQEKLSNLRCDSPSTPDPSEPNKDLRQSDQIDMIAGAEVEAELVDPEKSLTWHESEITGHEIDTAADDDGEGINGVGFLPTAAIASRRQAWRRRQLTDYKSRELKDARQRRYEKRKATQIDTQPHFPQQSVKRRAVRFAEA